MRQRPRGRQRQQTTALVASLAWVLAPLVVGIVAGFVAPSISSRPASPSSSARGGLADFGRRRPPRPSPFIPLNTAVTAARGAAATPPPSKLTPAQRVQHAREPEDILQAVTEELPALKPTHLATALLRMGKALVQPRHATRRRELTASAELQALVREALRRVAAPEGVRHAPDALLGMALLEYPLQAHQDVLGKVEEVFHHDVLLGGGGARFEGLAPGEVSALAWCWTKLGLEVGVLPAAFGERLGAFPFRVRIGALRDKEGQEKALLELPSIIEEVALRRDSITLGSKSVEESRLTAWQGPKPFYYSNKEMAPSPMTPRIAAIRDKLAAVTGVYYDCVLINLYEDGKTAMRYHIDPDQGVHWTTNTAVVSIGDTREFCLRDIETKGQREHHRFFVSQADAVEMVGDCQERYQHAVKVCEHAADAGPRISLVYKETLRSGGVDAGI